MLIEDPGTEENRVQNNLIGTTRDLQPFRGSRQDTGVVITREARFNAIEGPSEAVNRGGNTIAFNDDDGILVGGQFRGATDTTDANPIRFNSIHGNGGDDGVGLGINFDSGIQDVPGPAEAEPSARQPRGIDVTANDPLDNDTGPNNEQNHDPLLPGSEWRVRDDRGAPRWRANGQLRRRRVPQPDGRRGSRRAGLRPV